MVYLNLSVIVPNAPQILPFIGLFNSISISHKIIVRKVDTFLYYFSAK